MAARKTTSSKTRATKAGTTKKTNTPKKTRKKSCTRPSDERCPVVAIGASAGGLEALGLFFRSMPPESGLAFVVVAHLDPGHVSQLPHLLQQQTAMKVDSAHDGARPEPNTVSIIPPNRALTIEDDRLRLRRLPAENRMTIDRFMRSLAEDRGHLALGVVLSGTGTDGTLGIEAIKGEAGMVMVQSPETAGHGGMPQSAIGTGLADFVLAPDVMPEQLMRYAERVAGRRPVPERPPDLVEALKKIFGILRARTNHDFSRYKKNTILRRIERRMNVHQIDRVDAYVELLGRRAGEVDVLFKELLIGVTSFFRDPEAFAALAEKGLTPLLESRPDDATLRVWVPACASGEEAYSIAILLHELIGAANRRLPVQIFGTDIDPDAVAAARAGLYPASIIADVGPQRLARYFTREEDGRHRIKKSIREMLVFAEQNLIKDPPFTKLDLISCRNLLIYLDSEPQLRLLPILHYSLVPDGLLFLGSSESVGQAAGLFVERDRRWKIFSRRPVPATLPSMVALPALDRPPDGPPALAPPRQVEPRPRSAVQLLETVLRHSGTPPCVVVDRDGGVRYIHGRTGRFLEPPEGEVSTNLIDMARPGLRSELSAALRLAALHREEVVQRGLRVRHNGESVPVDLIVRPMADGGGHGLLLVIFRETATAGRPGKRSPARKGSGSDGELREELQRTRQKLQSTIGELELSNEELRSANEELQSTNEELQSTNEELETSKEELQSLNEESTTVNAELQARIEELSTANDDMRNLLDSTDIATVFLDSELRVRRFTPTATDLIPLAAADTGRPVQHLANHLVEVDIAAHAARVLRDLGMAETQVRSKAGRDYRMRVRPYRTVSNVIDGVVITFEDVSLLMEAEDTLRRARDGLEQVVQDRTLALRAEVEERRRVTEVLRWSDARRREVQRLARIVDWDLDPQSGQLVLGGPLDDLLGVGPVPRPETLEELVALLHPEDRHRLSMEGLTHAAAGRHAVDLRLLDGDDRVLRARLIAELTDASGGDGPARIWGTLQILGE